MKRREREGSDVDYTKAKNRKVRGCGGVMKKV